MKKNLALVFVVLLFTLAAITQPALAKSRDGVLNSEDEVTTLTKPGDARPTTNPAAGTPGRTPEPSQNWPADQYSQPIPIAPTPAAKDSEAQVAKKIKTVEGKIQELGKFVVVIDPGHPSEVSGGANANGIKEVDVCWDVGQDLAKLLAKKRNLKVLVNRNEKMTKMTNQARAEFANKNKAAVCVRLHCDYNKPTDTGYVVYYPDTQGTIRGKTGPSDKVISKSRIAAHSMHKGLIKRLAGLLRDGGVKTDRDTEVGAKNGGALIGSIFSEVPTLVVEMIYINNPKDAQFITSAAGRKAMVEGLAAGVDEYIKTLVVKTSAKK